MNNHIIPQSKTGKGPDLHRAKRTIIKMTIKEETK